MRLVTTAAMFVAVLLLPALAAAAETEEVTLEAEGMYCPNCEARVESAVGGLDGVESVSANHNTQQATVTYDPSQVSPEDMVAAINNQTSYVGRLPGEDGDAADDAGSAEAASADGDGSTGDGQSDGEVAQAEIAEQTTAGDTGLPTGALLGGVGAVVLLVVAGGGWLLVRR